MQSESRFQGALLPDSVVRGPTGVDLSTGYEFLAQVAVYRGAGVFGDVSIVKEFGLAGTASGVTLSWLEDEVDALLAGNYMIEVEATEVATGKHFTMQKLLWIRPSVAPEPEEIVLDGGGA